MAITFDVVLASIVIVCVFRAFSLGFVSSLLGFASLAVAYLAAHIFAPVLGDFLINSGIAKKAAHIAAQALITNEQTLPGAAQAGAGLLEELGANAAIEHAVDILAGKIIRLFAFAAIFTGASILFQPLRIVLNGIFRLPVLGTFNRLLGLVFGLLQGLLLSALLCAAIALIIMMFPESSFAPALSRAVEESYFCQKIYGIALYYKLV